MVTISRLLLVAAAAVACVTLSVICLSAWRETDPATVLVSERSRTRFQKAAGGGKAKTHQLQIHKGTDWGDSKVFGDDQVFAEGDVFGDHNHFGKGARFSVTTRFGDDNTFGGGSVFPGAPRFGPGNDFGDEVTIGAMATVGAGAKVGEGSVVGENSAFGPDAEIGKNSFLAEGLIFSGGDHFGEGITFGPHTRFGPNTIFDGKEVFSKGCTFGDNTQFNYAKAGKDVFKGEHYFGDSIDWGGNDALPSSPQASAHDAPLPKPYEAHSHKPHGDAGLPPGYAKTSIPGVYQYTAPAEEEEEEPHEVEWKWNHPTALPVDPAGLIAPPQAASLASHSAAATAAAKRHLAHRAAAATGGRTGQEATARKAHAGAASADGQAKAQGGKVAAWLEHHPSLAQQGPALELASRRGSRREMPQGAMRHGRGHTSEGVQHTLDAFQDNMVKVRGSALNPTAPGDSISFDDMF